MEFDPKVVMPIITLIIGIFIAPVIEILKDYTKARAVVKNLKLELEDETLILGKSIQTMAKSMQQLISLAQDSTAKHGCTKYVPRETSCYFLEIALNTAFQRFSIKQRRQLKVMKVQIAAINGYAQKIKEISMGADITANNELLEEQIKHCKRYIFTSCCLCYSMQVLQQSSKKRFSDLTDEEIINTQLKRLATGLDCNDLKITGSLKMGPSRMT